MLVFYVFPPLENHKAHRLIAMDFFSLFSIRALSDNPLFTMNREGGKDLAFQCGSCWYQLLWQTPWQKKKKIYTAVNTASKPQY